MFGDLAMDSILSKFGAVAGIGGLALGVFLVLFRKIDLPKATRRHLTLFMWLVWSICVIGIASFVFGQHTGSNSRHGVGKWTEIIGITYPDNDEFIQFLDDNMGRTIYLSTFIDMSIASEESQEIVGLTCSGDEEGPADLIESFILDPSTPLPLDGLISLRMLEFEFLANGEMRSSHGGTGVVQFPVNGYFRVTRFADSGCCITYRLSEIPVSMTERGI